MNCENRGSTSLSTSVGTAHSDEQEVGAGSVLSAESTMGAGGLRGQAGVPRGRSSKGHASVIAKVNIPARTVCIPSRAEIRA